MPRVRENQNPQGRNILKRRTLAAMASVAVVALAGCSSSETKNDYVDTVNEIQIDVQEATTEAAATAPSSKADVIELVETTESALADAVAKLEDVDVPSEAEAGHEDFVAGVDELRQLFADAIPDIEKASATGAFEPLAKLQGETIEVGTKIDTAIDKINADIGAEGS